MEDGLIHKGGCLCGDIRFEAIGPANNPHTCSCEFCRRHSGALVTAWVEFPAQMVRWTGSGGAPATFRSSSYSSRAFCPACGSAIGAIDDDPVVALMVGVFDQPDHPELTPTSHSFEENKPGWWAAADKRM